MVILHNLIKIRLCLCLICSVHTSYKYWLNFMHRWYECACIVMFIIHVIWFHSRNFMYRFLASKWKRFPFPLTFYISLFYTHREQKQWKDWFLSCKAVVEFASVLILSRKWRIWDFYNLIVLTLLEIMHVFLKNWDGSNGNNPPSTLYPMTFI